jgi:hypothetical protein
MNKMLKTHAKATIKDISGINDVDFEVGFDPHNKNSIKVTLAGKVSFISKDDLWNFVFSVVQVSQQQRMIPVTKTDFEQYKKQHEIKLQKDMKAGETVIAHCVVNVRQEVVDVIKREEEEKKLSTEGVKSPYLQNGLKL